MLVAAATASANWMFSLGRAIHPERPAVNLVVIAGLLRPLKTLNTLDGKPELISVGFMGDSSAIAYPSGRRVHQRLHETLERRRSGPTRYHVTSLSSLGMTPAGFYLLQDEINEAHPDIAIVTANLALLRDPLPRMLERPQLAGWVAPERWWDTLVGLDLHKYGVTADRLLLYNLLVRADLLQTWLLQTTEQARLGHMREDLEQTVADRFGFRTEVSTRSTRRLRLLSDSMQQLDPPRRNTASAQAYYGEIMDGLDEGHWVLEILQALLEDFARAGTAVILYVPPINVEHVRSIGVHDEAGLMQSLAALERIARQTGAEFADLHDILPDEAFRDTGGHFTHESPYDGPLIVAATLSTYVEILGRQIATTR
jgi:hypothetical protein